MQKVKKMGVWELTLLVLVNMMGSGIILLPTKLASVGTISILSWFITGGAVACLAYAFAKCGMFSRRGGGMGGGASAADGLVPGACRLLARRGERAASGPRG